jgi:hypothetical protein
MSSLASLAESDLEDDDGARSLASVSESVAHSVGSTAAHLPLLDEAAAAARAAIALDRGHDYAGKPTQGSVKTTQYVVPPPPPFDLLTRAVSHAMTHLQVPSPCTAAWSRRCAARTSSR